MNPGRQAAGVIVAVGACVALQTAVWSAGVYAQGLTAAWTADLGEVRRVVVDYDRYHPLAPGIALIKAPGHTPGSQMVYVVLESGQEFLLIGDTAWHMDGVRLVKGKDAPWINEDAETVLNQLRWLNELSRVAPGLLLIASHDDEQHQELIRKGVLRNRLE